MTGPERRNERATLQKVAELAGVSASTVSLVLAGKAAKRRISGQTTDRVVRAAEQLNYAPNLLTRSLKRGRTHILSFFSSFRHRERDDLYMNKLSSAIEMAGGATGYDVLVHCNFGKSSKELYQFLNGGFADGLLLFAPRTDDPLLSHIQHSSLPTVLINGRNLDAAFPSVQDDMADGIRQIAQNLVEYGHSRVAILGGAGPDARDAQIRVALAREALLECGVSVPDAWILGADDDTARDRLKELMAERVRPTAVFCWHDRLAYRALSACESLGIAVPEEISIIGYDGLQWPSSTRHLAASICVDLDGLALAAVRILDQYINGYRGPLIHESLPVTFSKGTSFGRICYEQRSHV